jgi:nucleotidyltransferase substrate binding protein (TIGR01987 family)
MSDDRDRALSSESPLDLTAFRSAVGALGDALGIVDGPQFAGLDAKWQDLLRSGVVQHFEFTYELGWRMLKRQLEREVASPAELDQMNYRDLIRVGHERGLVDDVPAWFQFRLLRNITSHTYSREKAQRVVDGAAALLLCARDLLQRLEARNHG